MFKLAPPIPPETKWTETVLYSFCGEPKCSDGSGPSTGLLADSKGNLYGTTVNGGSGMGGLFGAVFKLAPPVPPATKWTETVLYSLATGLIPRQA